MNLLEKYGKQQVTEYRLWIIDGGGDVFQIQCDGLTEFHPDPNYMGVMQGSIDIKDWVWKEINIDCGDWHSRLRMLLITDGFGNEKAYKILSEETFKQECSDGSILYAYRFRCREDKENESS